MFDKVKQQIKAKRGQLQVDSRKCTCCGHCRKRCPANAISVDRSAKGWLADHDKCVRCGRCIRICPNHALSFVKNT